MSNSNFKMFSQLYLKDLHEVTTEILIVLIGVVLVTIGSVWIQMCLRQHLYSPCFCYWAWSDSCRCYLRLSCCRGNGVITQYIWSCRCRYPEQ